MILYIIHDTLNLFTMIKRPLDKQWWDRRKVWAIRLGISVISEMIDMSWFCMWSLVTITYCYHYHFHIRGYNTLSTELHTECYHKSIKCSMLLSCKRSDFSVRSVSWQKWVVVDSNLTLSMDNTTTGRMRVCTLWRYGVPCPVSVALHSVWQHIGQSTTATSRHCRDMTSDVKAMLNPNKQTRMIKIDKIWINGILM